MSVAQLGKAGRVCGACRYFDAREGLCRFSAPSVVGWPSAKETDWCGEWTPPRTEGQVGEEKIRDIAPLSAAYDQPAMRGRG